MASKADIRAGRAFVELFVKGAKLEQGLAAAGKRLKAFGDSASALGRKLAGVGATAGVGISLAVKRFAGFDDQMRAVAAVSQSTDAQLKMLTATAEKLGAATSFTAVEVGSLMTELGRAGFNAEQIDKMTGAVLDLARATGTDATLASGIMAATIRQFGLDASESGRVADAFTVAANKSFNTVEQLGEALNYAGPVAHDFNMTLEETLAIFGGLGNMGIQASNAGTAVRRLLTLTGSEAQKMKDIFGVTFTDAAGNARPLIDVLEEVNEATKNLGTAERAAKFNEAFGLLGITAASALGATAGSVKELQEALENASGAAGTTAEKMDAGMGGALRILLSAVENVALKLGSALAPTLQIVAANAIKIAGVIGNWIDRNRSLVVVITAAIAAVTAFGAGLMALGVAASIAGVAISGLSSIVTGAIALFSALASPITLLVAPIALVAASWVALGGALLYASGLVPQVLSALSPLVDAIKGIADALGGGDFQRAWDIAVASAKYFGSVVLDVMDQMPVFVGYAMGRVGKAVVDALTKAWTFAANSFERLMSGMLDSATEFAPLLIQAMFSGSVTAGVANVMMSMRNVVDDIAKTASGMVDGFSGGPAPTFTPSERTNRIGAALRNMTQQPKQPAASPPASLSGPDDPFATPGPTSGAGGGFGGTMGSRTFGEEDPTPEVPFIEPSLIDQYTKGIDELTDALFSGAIEQDQYDAGVAALKRNILGISDPIADYTDRVALLDKALADGTITGDEYSRAMKEAKAPFDNPTPIERYHDRVAELKRLFDAGIIDEDAFKAGQMDALPDKVKQIIERSKTPLEKFNEQISELRDLFSAGLINREQFAAEQERLQKELRGEDKKKESRGRVSVSFSAFGLIAQGRGGGGASDRVTGKMDQQLAEQREQNRILRRMEDALDKAHLKFK